MRKLVIAASIIVVLIAVLGVLARYYMGRPLYEPGAARAAVAAAPAQPADGSYWEMGNGIRLYHFADGVGRNVLFVHGGPGYPMREAPPGLARLHRKFRFVYYDQRGCGRSSRPVDRFTSSNYYSNMKALNSSLGLEAQIGDIERIRRILGDDTLILLGHSFGGFLASLYAAEFPERVKALILVAPADLLVLPAAGGDLFETVRRKLPDSLRQEYASYLERYFDFRNIFSRSEAELRALNSEFAKYYAAVAKLPASAAPDDNGGWMVQAMYFSMGQRHDYRAAMKNVAAPVLVLHGANDLQPEAAGRAYAAAFPNSRFGVIPNAGHFPFVDQPAEFAAAVGGFLGEL